MPSTKAIFREVTKASLIALSAGSAVAFWYEHQKYTESQSPPAYTYTNHKSPIVYCTKDIPAGTIIGEDSVAERYVDEEKVPANALRSKFIAIGRSSKYLIVRGQILDFEDFDVFRRKRLSK